MTFLLQQAVMVLTLALVPRTLAHADLAYPHAFSPGGAPGGDLASAAHTRAR